MRGHGWTESKGKMGQQPLALRTLTNHPGNQARELRSQTQDLTGPLRHLFPALAGLGYRPFHTQGRRLPDPPPIRLVLTPFSLTKWEVGLDMPHPHTGPTRHPEVPTHSDSPARRCFPYKLLSGSTRSYAGAPPDQSLRAPRPPHRLCGPEASQAC